MKKLFLVIVFFLLSQVAKANANCFENWYIAVSPSVAWHHGHKFSIEMVENTVRFHRHYKRGWGGNASLGFIIESNNCFNLRAETEFVYRKNHLKKINLEGFFRDEKDFSESYCATGYNKDAAILANLFIEIMIPANNKFKIYLGVGLGAARNTLSVNSFGDFKVPPPHAIHSWLVARQLLLGGSYQLTNCIALTLGYRLFSTGNVRSSRYEHLSDNTPYTQSIDLGLRFQF